MTQRRWWIGIIAGGALCAAGVGACIWMQAGRIEEARNGVTSLKTNIATSRKLIEGTSALEREVIVLRELSEVMKGILPDNDDVNNLVRTFQRFAEDSGVRISGLKRKNANEGKGQSKADFDKIAYTLSLEGDAFQYMDFLDLIESHSRFMKVPTFRISAAQRTEMEKEGVPSHKVQVDVETYVYEPQKDAKEVRIDGYERKRDLLLGEMNRRKQSLLVSTYSYRGARGRRDPWIDPRVPVQPDGPGALSVQEQMDIVQGFYEKTQALLGKWEQAKTTEIVIVQMMMRDEVEKGLVQLEEELRRVLNEKTVVYVPSERRLQTEVVDPLNVLRNELTATEAVKGPSETQLREIELTMVQHMEDSHYELVLETFGAVDNRLEGLDTDPLRKPIVERLRDIAYEARTVLDFEQVEIAVRGIVLIDGAAPVAMINGKSISEGDSLGEELVVRAIKQGEIEFIFRGVVFARRF
jgi:Tfp pilus assembly protein PilO